MERFHAGLCRQRPLCLGLSKVVFLASAIGFVKHKGDVTVLFCDEGPGSLLLKLNATI